MAGFLHERDKTRDWFRGVAPSDLARLSNRDLFTAGMRLASLLESGAGTPEELANAADALAECYREGNRRKVTMWSRAWQDRPL